MQLRGKTDSGEPVTLDVSKTWVSLGGIVATILVALISAGTSYFTNRDVTKPRDSGDLELKKQTQLLEMQKFQLELLQRALQGKNSKQRAQSLRMLVDMKLLDAPRSMIDDFIKNPNAVPQWLPESTERTPSPPTSSGGKPIT